MAALAVRLPFDDDHYLTQCFGENPYLYKRFSLPGHNGIDWGMPVGSHIVAVDDGEVILQEEAEDGFGFHLKLEHKWGQSLYAHLSEFQAALGQKVKEGDVIALSGNSGFSTGPHLHFGMRVNPYRKGDGWYGYANPHRFLNWPELNESAKKRMSKLEKQLKGKEKELIVAQEGFEFERQELHQQADLWNEAVTQLLKRYVPGELPKDVDVLSTLDSLMHSWAQEVEGKREREIAGIFGAPLSV